MPGDPAEYTDGGSVDTPPTYLADHTLVGRNKS